MERRSHTFLILLWIKKKKIKNVYLNSTKDFGLGRTDYESLSSGSPFVLSLLTFFVPYTPISLFFVSQKECIVSCVLWRHWSIHQKKKKRGEVVVSPLVKTSPIDPQEIKSIEIMTDGPLSRSRMSNSWIRVFWLGVKTTTGIWGPIKRTQRLVARPKVTGKEPKVSRRSPECLESLCGCKCFL